MVVKPTINVTALNVSLSRKKDVEIFPLDEAKSKEDGGSADSAVQVQEKCFEAHSSADIVVYGATQQTFQLCSSVDQASSPTMPSLGSGTCDWTMDPWKGVAWLSESRFVIHHVDGGVRVRRLPSEQLLHQCTAGPTQAGGGGNTL